MEKHTNGLMPKTQYSLFGSTVQVRQKYTYYIIFDIKGASRECVKPNLVTTEGTQLASDVPCHHRQEYIRILSESLIFKDKH